MVRKIPWQYFSEILFFKASALWADAFYKSKCTSVRVSVCLFTFEVPFKRLFAPTSRSRMSNILRDSESLGKSNGKKWSQIWTFLFKNCLKSPRKKKVFFFTFFGLLRFSVFFNGLFASSSRNRMSNIFRDSESLGEKNWKKWSNIWTFLFRSGLKWPRKKKFFYANFAGLFQWGGYITTWGGYIEIWCGYIGMMRLYWDWFWMIFSVFQKNRVFGVFLVRPPMASVLLSASVERFSVSCMRDFFQINIVTCLVMPASPNLLGQLCYF